jgi:hypothetical protein
MYRAPTAKLLCFLGGYRCRKARVRTDKLFRDISSNNDKATLKLTKRFIQGEFEWMEDEIV